MKAIELVAGIDKHHQLRAQVPSDMPAGPVRVIVLLPEEDDAGVQWMQGLTREWAEESDASQDIYTMEDGQPVNGTR